MEDTDSKLVSFHREKDSVNINLEYSEPNTNTQLLTNQQLLDAVR